MSKGVMYVDNIRVEYDNEPNVLEVCRKAGVEIPNFYGLHQVGMQSSSSLQIARYF